MRLRLFFVIILVGLIGAPGTQSRAQTSQGQQDDVVDEFIGTRGAGFGSPDTPKSTTPKSKGTTTAANSSKGSTAATGPKSSGNKATSNRTRPSQQQAKNSGSKKGGASSPDASVSTENNSESGSAKVDTTVKASSVSAEPGAIGLGYTLYMEDAQGDGVRVDPAREFNEGDSIRLGLEANTNGYIYVFHTEDGRNLQMLFPNARVDEGSNRLSAHVLENVPSNAWFKFDANPAIERLYIVVSRDPIAGVPTGAKLVEQCAGVKDDCFWKPSPDIWQRITSAASGGRVVESKSEIAQVKAPADTMKRGFTLTKSEPAPTVVRMNASANSGMLITTIDLVHK